MADCRCTCCGTHERHRRDVLFGAAVVDVGRAVVAMIKGEVVFVDGETVVVLGMDVSVQVVRMCDQHNAGCGEEARNQQQRQERTRAHHLSVRKRGMSGQKRPLGRGFSSPRSSGGRSGSPETCEDERLCRAGWRRMFFADLLAQFELWS